MALDNSAIPNSGQDTFKKAGNLLDFHLKYLFSSSFDPQVLRKIQVVHNQI